VFPVQAIVFDFDGVLVESVEVKTRAFAHLFAQEPPVLVQEFLAFHLKHGGLSRVEKLTVMYRDILKRPLSEDRLRALCEAFAGLVVDEVVAAPWVEGAEEFLLRHRGRYRFFVVSGTPQEELREIIRRRGIEALFDGILGSPRMKTELLREVVRCSSLGPAAMVFIGDSSTDWDAARATGMPFVWRQSPGSAVLDGCRGPRITSLAQLDDALAALEQLGTIPR